MNNNLVITLKKSLIGRVPKHIEIAKQLGVTKINKVVILPNNPSVLGMVHKISYLVDCKESVL